MTKGILVWGQIDLSSSIKLVFFSISLSLSALFSPPRHDCTGTSLPVQFTNLPLEVLNLFNRSEPLRSLSSLPTTIFWCNLVTSVSLPPSIHSLVHSSKSVTVSDPLRAAKGPQRGLPWSHGVPGGASRSPLLRRQGLQPPWGWGWAAGGKDRRGWWSGDKGSQEEGNGKWWKRRN